MIVKTIDEARRHFTEKNRITKCKNEAHHFKLGRMMGYWQWATDAPWVGLDEGGNLVSYWLHFGTVETQDDLKGYKIIIGKLIVMFGFV